MFDKIRSKVRRLLGKSPMQKKVQGKTARRHHYIPQFYLAGFTDSGEKNGLLYAHDLRQLRTWQGRPSNVGFEKDFYKIDVPGIDADEIEKVFWDVEGAAAKVLKKIIQKNKLPGRRIGPRAGEDGSSLLQGRTRETLSEDFKPRGGISS